MTVIPGLVETRNVDPLTVLQRSQLLDDRDSKCNIMRSGHAAREINIIDRQYDDLAAMLFHRGFLSHGHQANRQMEGRNVPPTARTHLASRFAE